MPFGLDTGGGRHDPSVDVIGVRIPVPTIASVPGLEISILSPDPILNNSFMILGRKY